MNSNLKISVIIPVYNSEKTIKRSIQSVINQSVEFYELILINDGSVDNSKSILKEIKKENSKLNIKILNQLNSGPSSARNKGILNSQGEWVAFLDSDDEWLPNKLKRQIDILNKHEDCVIIGALKAPVRNNFFFYITSFKSFLFKNQFVTSSVMVKKEIVLKYMFDEKMKYAEDYKLWLNILNFHKGIVVNEKLVNYANIDMTINQNRLSSSLLKMEKGELSTYTYLYKKEMIKLYLLISIYIFSLLKYARRVFFNIVKY